MVVDEQAEEAIVGVYRVMSEPNLRTITVKLEGLDENKIYEIVGRDRMMSGAELMYIGYRLMNILRVSMTLWVHWKMTGADFVMETSLR